MADNLVTTTTVSTVPAGTRIATHKILSWSGEEADIAPVGLVTVSGSEGSKTATDVTSGNPLPVTDALGSTAAHQVTQSGYLDGIETLLTTLDGRVDTLESLIVTTNSTLSTMSTALGQIETAVEILDNAVSGNELQVDIVSGAGSGGTALADRTGTFTPGSTSYTPIGGYVDDSASDALAEGNPGAVRMTTARGLHVNLATTATGTAVVNGSGNATGAIRVELPTNGTGVLATVGTVTTVTTLTGTTSLTPGTAATNLGKAIDSAVGSTDTGVASLMRRIDTPATVTPVVADWIEMRGDAQGRQWVQTGGGSTTGTLTNVTSSASNGTVLASNTARKGFVIFNDSTSLVYLKAGTTASSTSFTWKLLPGESFERMGPCYTGIIDGIWASANGSARVTEFT
jgi:hypothetical protein